MIEMLPEIRNATRGVIIRDGELLVLRKVSAERGEWLALPGGAQDAGETLQQALSRECIEEIGTAVDVGELVHVADFFKRRDTEPPTRRHLVEFLFRCGVPDDYVPHNGHHPDKHQVDVIWVPTSEVPRLTLLPQYLSSYITPLRDSTDLHDAYLGAFEDDAVPPLH